MQATLPVHQPIYISRAARKTRTPELEDAESQQYSPYPRFSRCASVWNYDDTDVLAHLSWLCIWRGSSNARYTYPDGLYDTSDDGCDRPTGRIRDAQQIHQESCLQLDTIVVSLLCVAGSPPAPSVAQEARAHGAGPHRGAAAVAGRGRHAQRQPRGQRRRPLLRRRGLAALVR